MLGDYRDYLSADLARPPASSLGQRYAFQAVLPEPR